jgi:putative solute:sodium symporter small subunit
LHNFLFVYSWSDDEEVEEAEEMEEPEQRTKRTKEPKNQRTKMSFRVSAATQENIENRKLGIENNTAYWRKNLKYLLILLSIWFIVAYGGGIFFKDAMDKMHIGGFKLGFWIAQQGSIYVFVIIIFIYVWLMNRLDRSYGVYED